VNVDIDGNVDHLDERWMLILMELLTITV